MSSSTLDGFAAFVDGIGLDAAQLLSAAGLPSNAASGEQPLSLNSFASVLDAVARRAQPRRPCIGIEYAAVLPLGATGPLGFMLVTTPTVRDALKALVRYRETIIRPIDMEYTEQEDGIGSLSWCYSAAFTAPRQQYISFATAVIIHRLRRIVGDTWVPLKVECEYHDLEAPEIYRPVFGARVTFNCKINRVHFDPTTLNKPNAHADERLFRALSQIETERLALRQEPADIVARAQRHIERLIGMVRIDIDVIADRLGMTPRALQAQLKHADTSFDHVLRDTRRAMAEHLVKDTDLPLTDIALTLGFAELSSFTRAFKSETKISPREFRQAFRVGGAGVIQTTENGKDFDRSG